MEKATEAQIRRIRENEERMDRCLKALPHFEETIEQFAAIGGDLKKLQKYYTGAYWRKDFEADENGLLPPGMKRGVLSEDGLNDLLDEYDELIARLRSLLS